MPYQPTWQNPYLTAGAPAQPAMQPASPPAQPQPTVWPQYQPPVNGVVRVNGRDSAMQYQLPPNSTSPALFDSNGRTFYIVSTDGTGMKSVEAFDYSEHKEEPPVEVDGARFVSREEFDQFAAKVNAVLGARSHGIDGAATAATADAEPVAAPAAERPVARGVDPDAEEAGAGRHAGARQHARQL